MADADHGVPAAELASRLTGAVREAGALALTYFRRPVKQWVKAQSSPVSEADIAVDELLRARLAGESTGLGWLSEETEAHPSRLEAKRIWIVDPIDGTRAFLAGQVDWTISVALAVDGRPVMAAVFAPVTEEMYLATAGGGATLNGVPIAASSSTGFDAVRMAGPKRFVTWLATANPQLAPVPRIGSLALRLARVAQGELDLVFAGGTSHDWDLAAADLLVHEAGGAMTTLAGRTLSYNRAELVHGALVAAGRARHATLIDLMRDRLAELA